MSPLLDDDPELAALLERQRRFSARRAVIFGLVALGVTVTGALCILYGRSLEAGQAHADVHFVFPTRLMLMGCLLVGVGGLGAIASFVTAIRLRVRRGL